MRSLVSASRCRGRLNSNVRLHEIPMGTTATESCPLCDLEPQQVATSDFGKRKHLRCQRCGELRITTTAADRAKRRGDAARLSAWLRSRSDLGVETPEITSQNLDEIVSNLPQHSINDKQALLLEAISRRSKYPGYSVAIDSAIDYPVAWCENPEELGFHVDTLLERKLLMDGQGTYTPSGPGPSEYIITADGWKHLDEQSRPRVVSDQAFVAMSFDSSLLEAWENGIRLAAKRAGYKPFRTDAQPSIDRIDVRIMTEIRRSKIVIADVTLQRPGVYFEAGYAIGLGIPVFWCVRQDDLDKVHFDTRQYNHIVWETPADLEKKLHDFIFAVAGPASAA